MVTALSRRTRATGFHLRWHLLHDYFKSFRLLIHVFIGNQTFSDLGVHRLERIERDYVIFFPRRICRLIVIPLTWEPPSLLSLQQSTATVYCDLCRL